MVICVVCIWDPGCARYVTRLWKGELHRRHNQKAIAYREAARDLPHVAGQTFEPFGEYEDASRACGFVPSGAWLSFMYNNFVASKADVLNRHTAMLSLLVGAIDHSHKVRRVFNPAH